MRFTSADQLLRRWARTREQLESPRAASGVLHSGLVYGRRCTHPDCGGESWTEKATGKPPHRTYHPVCRRCGRDWTVDRADIRVGQVDCRRTGGLGDRHEEFAHLTRIITRPLIWDRRAWFALVLGPHADGRGLAYDQVVEHLQRKFGAKHASIPGGFFTPRHVRTLVGRARRVVEQRARRAGIWDGYETITTAVRR